MSEPLIAYSVTLPVSNDGKVTGFNFVAGRWEEPGDIQFECRIGPEAAEQRRFDWSFTVSVPGGGVHERTNRLDFEAPRDGYTQAISFAKRAADEDWQNGFSVMYFVKFGAKPTFARVELNFHPSRLLRKGTSSTISMKYWLNPSGSRNLEADPSKILQRIPEAYLRTGLPK